MSVPPELAWLDMELKDIRAVLTDIMRQGALVEKENLVSQGFLIHEYTLRKDRLDPRRLSMLEHELGRMQAIENDILHKIGRILKGLKEAEDNYEAATSQPIDLSRNLHMWMRDAFYLSRLAHTQVNRLRSDGTDARAIHTDLTSLERMLARIMRFVSMIGQLCSRLKSFTQDHCESSPRTYGRAMSRSEYRQTLNDGRLLGSPKRSGKDLIAVFDAPPATRSQILSMGKDQRKTFFQSIGVTEASNVVFFKTVIKPEVGPVPQSNGLSEYKIPRGASVELLEVA